ncbi:hypothetical protein LEP1GSC058_1917 [Leptospira fainei serovar Hurstbridge str. BUT 6]|uniref:Uncharacterized protein n=1 Tax=Leptospira fainei serovar Hurstbridge str. BUT 6 TaxID=1193011 RepID=S3VG91_9LEPT|nr:hypothetical protein LEP1GSC058_1917 [Leptospira fainei serovar Hurstbridge str. BUT 6]
MVPIYLKVFFVKIISRCYFIDKIKENKLIKYNCLNRKLNIKYLSNK